MKQISATLQSSKEVIDEAPEKSFEQSIAGLSGPTVVTVAGHSSDESDDDDFFMPTTTQMALGASQTPADQETTDDFFVPSATQMALDTTGTQADQEPMDSSVVCIDTAKAPEGQTNAITDSQTANPPNAPYENRIAEFDQTLETIDDPIEVSSSDSETGNPEFSFLDAHNVNSASTKEIESTVVPDIPRPKDTRWVFK